MKLIIYTITAALAFASCGKVVNTSSKVKSSLDSFSYTQGVMFAAFLKSQGVDQISYNAFYRGIEEGLKKDSGYLIPMESMNTVAASYVEANKKVKMEPLRKASKAYLDKLASQGYTKLASGAYYKVIKKGTGITCKREDTLVNVFTIKNMAGKEVANSLTLSAGQPTKVPVMAFQFQPLEEVVSILPAGSEFEIVAATDIHNFLMNFNKKFEDNYGVSTCNFKILEVLPKK